MSATASGASFNPVVSSDKRFVAFVSYANNLVPNDDAGLSLDLFLRDTVQATTQLISVNPTGVGGGAGDSGSPTISDDGRYVGFESQAGNLSPGDNNRVSDIFIRDIVRGTTTLASMAGSGFSGNGPSFAPKISGDGRWLVFESTASDLVDNDTNGVADVFIRDLVVQTTFKASADTLGAGPAIGPAESASMAIDGRHVAFGRRATNTLEGRISRGEIYVRDQQSGTTVWASEAIHHRVLLLNLPGYACYDPIMSADGNYVYFKVLVDTNPDARLYRYDLAAGVLTFATTNVSPGTRVSVNSAGDFAAYESTAGIYVWDAQRLTNILVAATIPEVQICTFPSLARQSSRITYLLYDYSRALTSVHATDLETGADVLVSVTLDGTNPADVTSVTFPVISADGRLVAYESVDPGIVAEDLNLGSDVFLRNLTAATTSLVSPRNSEQPNTTWNTASIASPQAMSANGKRVAYQRYDLAPVIPGELVPPDSNEYSDVWIRDLETGEDQFAGVGTLGTRDPVVSADGRFVAFIASTFGFASTAIVYRRDLSTGETILIASNALYTRTLTSSALIPSIAISGNGNLIAFSANNQVWVRDVAAATNHLISANVAGFPGGGNSTVISFRPDERWLLFQSDAMNLTDQNEAGLFARDLLTKQTRLLSSNFRRTRIPPMAAFSADSRFLAYVTASDNVEVLDLIGETSQVACEQCFNPSLAPGGQWVAYEATSPGQTFAQVYLKDLELEETRLVTASRVVPGGGGNGRSSSAQISYDGRFVVFASRANDLIEGDNNRGSDVFAYDRLRGVTVLLSVNRFGTSPGDGSSVQPTLAADGRTVVFSSVASDLTPGDYNGTSDVFVARLHGPDSDDDGLDDDWEMAYFSTLGRDGTGDMDGDGVSDRNEFVAGTIPTSDTSVLQVLTVTPMEGSGVTVVWSGTPGRAYRVEFKDTVDATEWQAWPATITAAGTTAALHLQTAIGTHRFYRVRQTP